MGTPTRTSRKLEIIGLTFVVLSFVVALWQWASGEAQWTAQLGIFTGGLIVLAIGLYGDLRNRHRPSR